MKASWVVIVTAKRAIDLAYKVGSFPPLILLAF